MLAHLACEVEEGEVLHPVVVVYELGLVRLGAVEVEELSHLLLYSLLVMVQSLRIEQIAFLALAGRVSNHTCRTTDKEVWLVSATLQVTQHHYATKVAYMQ